MTKWIRFLFPKVCTSICVPAGIVESKQNIPDLRITIMLLRKATETDWMALCASESLPSRLPAHFCSSLLEAWIQARQWCITSLSSTGDRSHLNEIIMYQYHYQELVYDTYWYQNDNSLVKPRKLYLFAARNSSRACDKYLRPVKEIYTIQYLQPLNYMYMYYPYVVIYHTCYTPMLDQILMILNHEEFDLYNHNSIMI